ncbi:hypothetical protein [Brevundimonas sp.]|uniref:hypothetical protein n=1 Tax=Brevundimonas sp. TaxID=1871086 RepID=UPI002AB980E8|nr:hypothetical protein [Brevundimonas sp.]MDZ4362097.1 hypothetical protein [Brevundimonas sp.]
MRLRTLQIIVALAAIVAFVLAFVVAGIALVSGAFMLAGLAAVAWLAWSLVRQVHRRQNRHPA